jgi:hypothetical protein
MSLAASERAKSFDWDSVAIARRQQILDRIAPRPESRLASAFGLSSAAAVGATPE